MFGYHANANAGRPVIGRLRRTAAAALAALVATVGLLVAPWSASPAFAAWVIEGIYPSLFDCQNVGIGGVNLGRWAAYECEPDYGGTFGDYRLWVDIPGTPPPPPTGSFYRLWNPTTGDHFSTIDPNEYNSAQQCCGYRAEGIRSRIAPGPGGGLVPFYRLWNPATGDHFHTTDPNEYANAQTLGYVGEGIRGYVYPANSSAGIPLYRVWNPTTGDHFHTISLAEVQTAQQLGYVYEGVRARALAAS